jgi:magnesium transporter
MITTKVRTASGEIREDVPVDQLLALMQGDGCLAWIDIENPSDEEVAEAGALLGWTELTVEDVAKHGQRAKLEHFGNYHYLVMHDLIYDKDRGRLSTPELDLVIGRNYVASVHDHHIPHVAEAREVTESIASVMGGGPDYLLYWLTDRLVDGYLPALDDMHDAVEDLEQAIISNPSENLLPRIFEMKRDAIALRRVISPQLEVFSRLTSPNFGIVSEDKVIYFRDVHDHLIRIFEAMDTYRELMSGALDAYLSNVNNRMNEVMKRLTILAALFLPLTFLTGLIGMNLRDIPPWKDDTYFWPLIVLMLTISLSQWLYFKRKGWV